MSDFSISSEQRQKLLEGVYRPLMFDVKPAGCEPGAKYVLVWSRPSVVVVGEGTDVEVVRTPRAPVWFLTVKSTNRVRKGDRLVWLVRFDVTDLRDRDVFLKPGGGELQGRDPLGGGRKPDAGWVEVRHRAVREFWHAERLKRHAERLREQGRARSKARRRRAA